MLPKIQRSIVHLGEKGGGDGHRGVDIHQLRHPGGQSHGRRERRGRDAYDVVVGLQILVQHHRHPRPCHVVLKQMVSWPPASHRGPCSFLRACSLCRRELSPKKDVYMYRGDQGFCSEECRRQQILRDEAREHEAMVRRERRGLPHHRRHHHEPRPTAAIRGVPRRLLAVA